VIVTNPHEEVGLSWSTRVRQVHRWASIAFTVAFIFVTVLIVAGEEEPAGWVYLFPLLSLGVLFLTGLYLFVLPHASRVRGRRPTGGQV
jgi:ABC-type polysaccharide/polyol phosphate export permease